VSEENFWTLWCKGRLTEAGTQTIRLGATPSRSTSAHLHHAPIFYRPDVIPATQPTVSKHWRQQWSVNSSVSCLQLTNTPHKTLPSNNDCKHKATSGKSQKKWRSPLPYRPTWLRRMVVSIITHSAFRLLINNTFAFPNDMQLYTSTVNRNCNFRQPGECLVTASDCFASSQSPVN